jgi:Ca2+-transporting ATPase
MGTQNHECDLPSLVKSLDTDANVGLTRLEAARRLVRDGKNALRSAKGVAWWRLFAAQFESLLIGLLIVAALIAGLLGDWIDTAAILAIVLLNAILGFVQEQRAQQAMAALHRLAAPQARVKRDGNVLLVPADELVVGDLIQLEAGDRLPADVRLIDCCSVQTMEASLTGESTPVTKRADVVLPSDTPLAERVNCLFAGTDVTTGKASAIVVATGMHTEIGCIAQSLQDTKSEPTLLQLRLTELGRLLVMVCLVLVSIIFIIQWLRGGDLVEVFLTSVSLAVAAVPEGLPAVVTVMLAIGMRRMAKRHALIRKLPSVETLGCVTVICSDKTGTLTRNEMTVRRLWVFDRSWRVDGEGYSPQGGIHAIIASANGDANGSAKSLPTAGDPKPLSQLLLYAASCNTSHWSPALNEAPALNETKSLVVGDPTEIALKVLAAKAGTRSRWSIDDLVHENPFDSNRKRMSQVYRDDDGALTMLVKGAPEAVLSVSTQYQVDSIARPLTPQSSEVILDRISGMAAEALRVLAIAYRRVTDPKEDLQVEADLTFIGLIGMIDPPRQEAAEAVVRCQNAGIRPVMITGDHPATAIAIAKAIGMVSSNIPDLNSPQVMLGSEIDRKSDEELASVIRNFSVIARVSAEHKLRVVQAWKSHGHVVAMTGDGVNDAPAVKAADIGIVMGITGTEVAKEAADMVLTDDNFASIVSAVEEGRGIYENTRKVLQFLLASNSSEVVFMFAASVVGWPSPLLAIQILWINLVTDSIPALALASEPLGKNLMNRAPRPVDESILNLRSGRTILAHGMLMALVAMAGFAWTYDGRERTLGEARAVAFCILMMSQIFYSMACRDLDVTVPQVGVFSNPLLLLAMLAALTIQLIAIATPWSARILGLHPMPWANLPLILGLSLIPVTLVELRKLMAQSHRA